MSGPSGLAVAIEKKEREDLKAGGPTRDSTR